MARRDYPTLRIHYRDPSEGWEGMLVMDTLVDGCSVGGVRVSRTVEITEVARLARGMTLKNLVLGLPQGGAKVGIRHDPSGPSKLEAMVRFFEHIKPICERMYSFGSDLNTTDEDVDAVARRIGLPSRLYALARTTDNPEEGLRRYNHALALPIGPFTVAEARTGYGVAACVDRAARRLGFEAPLRVAIQGFGAVGAGAAFFLTERMGHKVTAVSDAGGTYANASGLDVGLLIEARGGGRAIDPARISSTLRVGPPEVLFERHCDVLVLAAIPDAITRANADKVQAKIIVEGGNIAVSADAIPILHGRGIPVVPDFIGSAGSIASTAGLLRGWFAYDDAERLLGQLGEHMGKVVERAIDESLLRRLPVRQAIIPDIGEVSSFT